MLVSTSTGALNALLGKLATLMGEEYAKLKGVRKQVAFLHEELSSMGALFEDLADMESLDSQTKQWRNKLREMSYDIEDCLDEFMHRVGGSSDGKGLLHRLKTLRARHQLANRIQELKARVQEASARRMRYKRDDYPSRSSKVVVNPHVRYKLDDCASGSSNVVVDPRMTTLYAQSSRLVGIDGPKEEIINLLTKQVDGASLQEPRVVSIVGFGGLGKTTLANEVYVKLGEDFDCKAFVSVSQRPDMMMLLKSLATQMLGPPFDTSDINGLINQLRMYLQDKRYFVVGDDLWDASAWEIVKCAFSEGHYGSKVLTTTRIERVAVTCCNFQWDFVYMMKPLDDHNSRELFHRRVFGSGNACPQSFEEPSKKILRKCGGLPLAIVSIASLLASQSNRSVCQWNYVLNSLRSNLSTPSLEGMRQILNLSYTHLPHHLRTCLLYLGMYPEGHDIEANHLVMQWVAEGFVSGLDGRDALATAQSCFNELVNSSMIIQLVKLSGWNNELIYYKVHDMVLDLILSKSGEENFLGVVQNLHTVTRRQKYNARRLSLQLNESRPDKIAPQSQMSLQHVRSLFIFGLSLRSLQPMKLKFLHVLFVCKVGDLDLTPIGNLFQLRYLYVKSNNHLSSIQLPRKICQLHHLETLVICGHLSHLPHDIVDLPTLSYLEVYPCTAYPDGISNMKSLRTLESFDPCKQSVDNLRALGELLNLRELNMYITDRSFYTMEEHMGALLYSIEKLISCNLRRLTAFEYDDMTGHCDGWNSLCLSGCHLEELHLQFRFPWLPAWVGQLSTLMILEIHLDELDMDGIAALAGLPALARLVLKANHVSAGGIVFSSGAVFRALTYFAAPQAGLPFHFQAGALPMVKTLCFRLHVRELNHVAGLHGHGGREAIELNHALLLLRKGRPYAWLASHVDGIEQLANLKKVFICLGYSRSRGEESQVPTIEAGIRSFFDEHHPGGPIIHVTSYPYLYDD